MFRMMKQMIIINNRLNKLRYLQFYMWCNMYIEQEHDMQVVVFHICSTAPFDVMENIALAI